MTDDDIPDPGERMVRDHRRAGGPSAVVCSLATGRHRELLSLTAPTLHLYAQTHGWAVIVSSEDDLAAGRPVAWAKIRLVQELMTDFDYVFWVDADAIIVDPMRNILDEIDHDKSVWYARHPQQYDETASVLNAGVFLASNSIQSQSLLAAIWEREEYVHHNWWENAALLDTLGYSLEPPYPKVRSSQWDDDIGVLDLAWNSVPGYCESPTPAINHHARSDHDNFDRRLHEMSVDLESVFGTRRDS